MPNTFQQRPVRSPKTLLIRLQLSIFARTTYTSSRLNTELSHCGGSAVCPQRSHFRASESVRILISRVLSPATYNRRPLTRPRCVPAMRTRAASATTQDRSLKMALLQVRSRQMRCGAVRCVAVPCGAARCLASRKARISRCRHRLPGEDPRRHVRHARLKLFL